MSDRGEYYNFYDPSVLVELHSKQKISIKSLQKESYEKEGKYMTFEQNPDRWFCAIDIENTQHSISNCLQLILWLEQISENGFDNIHSTPKSFQAFFISRATSVTINSLSALLEQEKHINAGTSRSFMKIESGEKLLAGLQKEPHKNIFYYYIRIHLNDRESDITELQHFLLMLQAVPAIKNRIAVRLMSVPTVAWQTKDYFHVSHFLRFVQQKYRCFYACYNESLASLQSLHAGSQGTQSTFLPLLEVDGQLCQSLNKVWYLTSEYNKEPYDKLYTVIYPQNCNSDSITWLLFQIGLRMLFKNLSGKWYNKASNKINLLDSLCRLVAEVQGITPLDMLLFGALAYNLPNRKFDHNIAKELMGNVQMLSLSISQVLENIVNHSERNQGVFTFRLQNNEQYLKLHYPNYPLSSNGTCLELLIADSNRSDGIVQHFLTSNKADTLVKDLSENIRLAHLFGDFHDPEMKEVWQTAYKNRPEMCHGLISFSRGVRRLHGAIRVRSAPSFTSHDLKDFYYYNGYGNDCDASNFFARTYIPGTQFSVVVNQLIGNDTGAQIKNEDDWAFDFDKLVYATTYRELAQALTFDDNIRNLDVLGALASAPLYPHTQEAKDQLAIYWKEWFNTQIPYSNHPCRVIYQCDLDLFCQRLDKHPELGEPFCKGFLSSRFFINPNCKTYFGILLQNPSAHFSRIFTGTLQVVSVHDAFITENTCVYFYPKQYKGDSLPYCATTLHDLLGMNINEKIFPRVFPYTLFLKDDSGSTLFEQELIKQASTPIYNNEHQGYKLSDTHMRLGNKVHLDTFYEMALFFENPNYAYYTAFLFLRTFLKTKADLLHSKENILFYGYASYSRAIIWAILQILKHYSELLNLERFPTLEFIIYQNDLKLESDQPQVQMYYSKSEWQRNNNTIWDPENTGLVLIVPISSSLTTFNKMKAELCAETKKDFTSAENFTAFWVRNNYYDESKPTAEEEYFWQKANPEEKTIISNIVQGEIRYLVSVTSRWSNPLCCKKCFPDDPILEYPLVETDPTSTVPTQQFYCQRECNVPVIESDKDQETLNDMRVSRLKSNIVYGHVSKGSNHYQYYIKTREFFQQERDEVAQWLRNLRMRALDANNPAVTSPSCINILIIPQQANNVEFGQFVYEHYFQGCAECVIINTEKDFRSNLKAEYSGLFNRLRAVKNPTENIRFHYVDVSVNSGNSFNRAVSLLSSCMENSNIVQNQKAGKQRYEFQIDQVFLLVSRLSEDSKQTYTKNKELNFHAYVEVRISAMRTFGDSCVPCKLQYEAKRYYKKAATKLISAYWEEKIYNRACVPFDQLHSTLYLNSDLQEEGYRRMMCSHRATHFIRPVQGANIPSYFFAIRSFLEEIRCANTSMQNTTAVYKEIDDSNRKEWLAAGLKVIARPFFSFDYRMRCVVMDLFLILSEYLIKGCSFEEFKLRLSQTEEKRYLLQDGNLSWIKEFADSLMSAIGQQKCIQLEFIRNNILKGLADIKSNYILRKDTIVKLSKKLAEVCHSDSSQENTLDFYLHYLRSILRITHSSSDETKGVWLEYLLQHGEEYQNQVPIAGTSNGIEKLVSLVPDNIQATFRTFLEVLVVENNRPIYQAVLELYKRSAQGNHAQFGREPVSMHDNVTMLLSEYHMRNAKSFLSFQQTNHSADRLLIALQGLLQQLNTKSQSLACYQQLGEKIQEIVTTETASGSKVILFGKSSENMSPVEEYLNIPNYFTLYPERFNDEIGRDKSLEKIHFEDQWKRIECSETASKSLKNYGFHLLESTDSPKRFNIVIMLDNNFEELKDHEEVVHQKIEPIYIYISCNLLRQQALGLTRMILMFRCKLINWLESDFNNKAIAVMSQQQHLAKLLSTDKMGDHAEDDFVECQQKILMATTVDEFKNELNRNTWESTISKSGNQEKSDEFAFSWEATAPLLNKLGDAREWFLLRSYINSRISRLFRTMVRTGNDGTHGEIIDAQTYYARDGQSKMMRPAKDLQSIFFTPAKVGFIRKNYLRQIMKTVTFFVHGIPDYQSNPTANIEERLDNFSAQLDGFHCISFYSTAKKKQYSYLSEYLAIILLDCFISGLKAGEVWNHSLWGGKAFQNLCQMQAHEKCRIDLYREIGGICGEKAFDYLVIRNDICHPLRLDKKGPGMSQAAIRWYIEGLWRSFPSNGKTYPKVLTEERESEYIIKLPILDHEEV